ncbi:membrane protein [Streptomyces minutiscleroticus]|uniref:Membrane protein n=1 Tax=Streptomyces minutiscleroticus TaxID=68238 RepID=A0A918KM05_9ACTN|nr:glycosyltransferase 87 family protein [Streptomyces minutiscleroticus]GGX65944.1 membrane protein [Streptomyces minutiscleroticus]
MRSRSRLPALCALACAWLAGRALTLWLLSRDGRAPLGVGGVAREVHALYARWYETLATGAFPAGDPLWQYPPGAGAVLAAPGLLPGLTYFRAFVLLALAADAAVAVALARAGTRTGRSLRGAALWTGALPLLLHIPLARYDVQVTALAVFSLLTLERFPRAGGAFAALGALVKVWPALALLGAPPGRVTRRSWGAAAVTAGGLLAAATVLFRDPFDFLRQQGGRGVQIESLGGTVLAFAHRAGLPVRVDYRYGAMEFTGPYVPGVATASLALTAGAFAALLLWRLRARRFGAATPYDAALAAVLLFTVTSRVISPQYLVWLLGLAAVCLTSRHTGQRAPAALVTAAAAVSSLAYPLLYEDVMACTWTGCLLMLARNGLLVAAAALALRRLWRSTAGERLPARPRPPASARAFPDARRHHQETQNGVK